MIKNKLPKQLKLFKKPPTILLVVVMAAVGVYFLVGSKAAVGNATFSISPSSGSRAKDSSFTVSIYADSQSTPVIAYKIKLNYDQTKLQASNPNNNNSPYDGGCAVKSAANGLVTLICYPPPGTAVTGRNLAGSVTFKALVGSGSTSLTFAADSELSQEGTAANIWNGNTQAGTFTFTTPSSPNPNPNPGNPTNPSNPGTPSSPRPGSGGSSGNRGGSSPPPVGSPSQPGSSPTPANPTPSPDPSAGNDSQPQISGILAITVTDQNGQPAPGVVVKIGKQEVTTNALGVASFIGVSPGKHKVTASSKTLGSATKEITVGEEVNVAQEFSLQLKKRPNYLLYAGIGLLVILFIIAIRLLRRWLRNKKEMNRRFSGYVSGSHNASAPAAPANDTVATVVTPHSTNADSKDEADGLAILKSVKEKVEPTDTLTEIERKVGAKKSPAAPAAQTNDFEPNLITPKKAQPKD